MAMTMQEIRERYPNPRTVEDSITNDPAYEAESYCVGGACSLMLNDSFIRPERYPSPELLTYVLREYNHALDHDTALHYAKTITTENDAGRFANAWAVVELALKEGA